MATPLPGFLPGTLKTPVFGEEPGFGQVRPTLDVEEFSFDATDVTALTTSYAALLDNTDGPTRVVETMHIGNITGGAVTFSLRVRPSTVTPVGDEYNLAVAMSVSANTTIDFLAQLGSLVLKPGDVLEMLASANDSINVRLSYREPRHQ